MRILKQVVEFFWEKFGLSIFLVGSAWADNAPVPAGTGAAPLAQQPPGIGSMLLPFAAMFGVVYFLMIRPQQKKMKEQQEMLGQLKAGDEIVTTSGILGTITGITEKVATVEIAPNVRIKILKSQISQVVKGQLKEVS